MLNPDELEPPRAAAKPVDLHMMSVNELRAYISGLEAEIERAQKAIASKEAHRSGIEALFGPPKA